MSAMHLHSPLPTLREWRRRIRDRRQLGSLKQLDAAGHRHQPGQRPWYLSNKPFWRE